MSKNLLAATALLFAAFFTAAAPILRAADDPHAYFKRLTARRDVFVSYSLRDQQQLSDFSQSKNRRPAVVTYDPSNDLDPRRQDAAKVTIPVFSDRPISTLSEGVDATGGLPFTGIGSGRSFKIDDEIITYSRTRDGATYLRGQMGTSAASHAVGTLVYGATNSLQDQVRLPIGTEDGASYLFTWDAWFGREWEFANAGVPTYKTFQLGLKTIWFEVQTVLGRPDGNGLARVQARSYSRAGPNVTSGEPISPMTGSFTLQPERWTRYWVLVEQRADDFDLVSFWVADTEIGPVQLLDRRELDTKNGPIQEFYLEYNTSTDTIRPGRGTLVSYVRNLVVLKNAVGPTSLMERPVAGGPLPSPSPSPTPPSAPRNLRIVS